MAAEVLTDQGIAVDLYDTMPSLGRKFLMAGKSGLNLTHAEPYEDFLGRFGDAKANLKPAFDAFTPDDIQAWANGLGFETFIGSSKRVFPKDMKAAPLLRAWLKRLRAKGLTTHVRHKWTGWKDDGALTFDTPTGEVQVHADATVLAFGGASLPQLGSDAAWVPWLTAQGVSVTPLQPSNCGFDVDWSVHFLDRFEGMPVKNTKLRFYGETIAGEFVITQNGIEGGPVYGLSPHLRNAIADKGSATLTIDLLPDRSGADVQDRVARPRGKKSMGTHLKRTLNLSGVKAGLLYECTDKTVFDEPIHLASTLKALPLTLTQPRPVAEAISTAGGVAWHSMDKSLQLNLLPGVFVCGEMMDWDAPTGGYLLSACMATGRKAGQGALKVLNV